MSGSTATNRTDVTTATAAHAPRIDANTADGRSTIVGFVPRAGLSVPWNLGRGAASPDPRIGRLSRSQRAAVSGVRPNSRRSRPIMGIPGRSSPDAGLQRTRRSRRFPALPPSRSLLSPSYGSGVRAATNPRSRGACLLPTSRTDRCRRDDGSAFICEDASRPSAAAPGIGSLAAHVDRCARSSWGSSTGRPRPPHAHRTGNDHVLDGCCVPQCHRDRAEQPFHGARAPDGCRPMTRERRGRRARRPRSRTTCSTSEKRGHRARQRCLLAPRTTGSQSGHCVATPATRPWIQPRRRRPSSRPRTARFEAAGVPVAFWVRARARIPLRSHCSPERLPEQQRGGAGDHDRPGSSSGRC